MATMEKEIKLSLTLIILLFLFASCKKFVEVSLPKDRVIASRVFESDAKATSALNAVYGNMINGSPSFANFFTTVYAGLASDELARFAPDITDAEVMANNITPSNGVPLLLWRSAYQTVYYTNALIEGASNSPNLSPSVKNRIIGEAKFLRGFCYFYLAGFFGDVPLVTTTAYNENTILPRSPKATVLAAVLSDLLDAKNRLPAAYPNTERNRPNKYAVAALLARFYLYSGDWSKVESESTEIIASGIYTPLPAANTVFLKNSKEAIWQLSPISGFLKETSQFFSAPEPTYYLTASVTGSFEPGDVRRFKWIDSISYQSVKYYYPAKYRNLSSAVTEYYTVFRLAEIILIRAEARMQLGALTDAVDDINTVRVRAGLAPLLTNIAQPQVQDALEKERRSELFAEWGHRWFDLVRWNKATAVLSPIKAGWQSTDTLFPVPQEEINANSFLTQNPGY
jgi:starch-binding outer membrane protein, SusD/RagB family